MANKDRIYVSVSNRNISDVLERNKVLDLDSCNRIDYFLLAVAFGLDSPKPIQHKKDGLIRYDSLSVEHKALMASTLLGMSGAGDINDCANLDAVTEFCEQCAESGFPTIQAMFNDANGNEELFENMLLNKLDELYRMNVETDL